MDKGRFHTPNFLHLPRWYKPIGDITTSDIPPERVYFRSMVPLRSPHVALTVIDQSSGIAQDVSISAIRHIPVLVAMTIFVSVDQRPQEEDGPPILWDTHAAWQSHESIPYVQSTSRRDAIKSHIALVRLLSALVTDHAEINDATIIAAMRDSLSLEDGAE